MPDMTVTQQPLPAVAAIQPATGTSPADTSDPAATADCADFAAVLKQQLAQPAKDEGLDTLAALLPAEAKTEDEPQDSTAAPVDLSLLLPGIAAPAMNAGTPAPVVDKSAVQTGAQATIAAAATGPSAIQTGAVQPGALPFASSDAGKGDPPAKENGFAAARQPAFLAVAEKATADNAAPAAAAHEFRLPETAADHVVAANQHNPAMQPLQASQDNPAPAAVRVDTPVGARGWDNEVGQKVVWLASREESRAEMTLTPPHLGKIEVTLTVSGDQTNALFVSASPMARDALESALPRLREILAEAGITLGQASVNAESSQGSAGDGSREHARGGRDASPVQAAAATGQWVRRGNGLIDTFA